MKNIVLSILREIGIAVLLLVIMAAVIVVAFKDKLPYDEKVPTGDEYVKVNRATYSVSSTDRLSEINAITITHETNPGQIISAENEVRIQTGKYTPFGTISSTTDLPTERVGVTVAAPADSNTGTESEDTQDSSNSTDNSENSDIASDMIEDASLNETSEEAGNRRMGNAD